MLGSGCFLLGVFVSQAVLALVSLDSSSLPSLPSCLSERVPARSRNRNGRKGFFANCFCWQSSTGHAALWAWEASRASRLCCPVGPIVGPPHLTLFKAFQAARKDEASSSGVSVEPGPRALKRTLWFKCSGWHLSGSVSLSFGLFL